MRAARPTPMGVRTPPAYSLHRAYGVASLPWLRQAARDTKQILVRTSCAKELILANQADGFAYLLPGGQRNAVVQDGSGAISSGSVPGPSEFA
jgi:hypothetical protein